MTKRKLNILIIDDNLNNAKEFENIIYRSLPGSRVFLVTNAIQGLEIAKITDLDVVLIDVSVNKEDGLKISQIIKKHSNLQVTPMLLITDIEDDRKFREKILETGAECFLVKPIDDLVLISQLKVMAKVKERNMLIQIHNEQLESLVKSKTKELNKEIIERKKLGIELIESVKLFSSYIEKAPIGVFVANEKGQYTDVNEMACKMMGRSKKEILDLSLSDFLVQNQIEKGYADFQKLIETGTLSTEYEVKNKDDEVFWISLLGTKINENCILAFCTDISERKYAEEERSRLNQNLHLLSVELANKNDVLLSRLQQTISTLSTIGEMKDVYTAGHQRRVALLSCAIAEEMKLEEDVINNISIGALIHDIGKINIPSDILNKPGKLSHLEFKLIQCHVENSYEIVKGIDFPKQIVDMIHQHHERLDGSGYPKGLVGDEIILEGRIIAVSDVVEAMASHRPYRPAKGIEAALEEIKKNRGIKFDANVVDACVNLFEERGFTLTNQ